MRDRWGDGVIADGKVDRPAIARTVFSDESERKWLEGELWPRVGQRMFAWKTEQEALDAPPRALVVETPLLFEAGLDRGYDATVAVIADEEIRAQRAGSRGHEAVDERAKAQLTQQEKADRATYVVRNDGSLEELEQQMSEVLERLTAA